MTLFVTDVLTMNETKPRLSIGMPVFNGERYIRYAIDSILNQTYDDFELIISDNASTDETQNICLEYKDRDHRIRYYRNKKNIGAPENYNRVFLLSSGEYFKRAAYDDVLAPSYLEKCISVLDSDPSIVLCHSKMVRMDEDGVQIGDFGRFNLENIDSNRTHKRFGDMISGRNTGLTLLGIVRAGCMAKTPLHGHYIAADVNLTAELSLMGRIYEIPERLFYRRDHGQSYSKIYNRLSRHNLSDPIRDYSNQLAWWGVSKKDFLARLPRWKRSFELFRIINRVPLKFSEYLLCNKELMSFLFKIKKSLLIDIINEFQVWRYKLSQKQVKKEIKKNAYQQSK